MEELHLASIIQDDESAALTARAEPPAGSRFSEAIDVVTVPAIFTSTPVQPLYKRRWFIISQIILVPISIALLFIVLFPVVKAIAQLVVNRTILNIDLAAITQPQNNTFQLALQGSVSHAGIFSAKIQFTQPVAVTWINGSKEVPIGSMTLDPVHAAHKRATINQTTTFTIQDQDAFGQFAAYMITSKNFTWRLQSNDLHVQAVKFPLSKGIHFKKEITLNGINGFAGNVLLASLQLPSDNPAGGINFVAVTQLHNPSPFSLNLGTVVFSLGYKNVFLGIGTGHNTQITPGPNNITLSGFLQSQTPGPNLTAVSQLFTNYLNSVSSPVIATGVSTLQNDNTPVSWLSQGLQALTLEVPFVSPTPIDPIKNISIGSLGLTFLETSPWAPLAYSNSVQALLALPFGFNVSIGNIQNDFNITQNGVTVVGLSTPLGASVSNVSVLGPTNTSGTIDITIANTTMYCPTPYHPIFSAFNTNLTSLPSDSFRLEGNAFAIANTSIGMIELNPIKVNVSTSLLGLRGLKGLTNIGNVDVVGGTSKGINLGIDVRIFNPSNLTLATGDLSLQLFRNGSLVGTALLPNLILDLGSNLIAATSNFEANNNADALQTLNDFVGKKDVQLQIGGYNGSTNITSLRQAFNTLDINVTLPGLNSSLLGNAALTILPTTGRTNNISHVTVEIANPFTAALDTTRIVSTVFSHGILLGTINSTTNFSAAGKATTRSPLLDLDMNFDPAALFTVTRALAVEAGLDVAPLDEIVQIGGIRYLSTTGSPPAATRRANVFTGFNLPNFVQAAFKKLQTDVKLSADVTIGSYATTLQYMQTGVPTVTDQTLNLILPILAQPIVQKIVTGSVLSIDTVLITNPQQNSFGTALKGAITNAGPFDATISFGSGLTVGWSGAPIGSLKMSDVKVAADVGATINSQSTFEVADVGHLTNFTKTLLTQESFDWDISGENLTVSALGIDVTGINLTTKSVTLKGFNGLKNGVQIKSFDLPFNDPAGGIHLTIAASATNPSQVGVELSSIAFNTFSGNVMIAPVSTNQTVTLAPGSTTPLALVGRLVPQDSAQGLATVSDVFNKFIHGQDSDVVVQGVSAGPSDVTWLNDGIKSLQVATVLPNQGALNIIKSISLNQLELLFTEATAYGPATSSNSTDAAFTLPFAFPIDISALEQTITVGFQGQSFANLVLPKAPSVTDVQRRIIHLTFGNVPFAVFADQHATFNNFVAATTVGKTQTLHLSGAANADAKTAVGLLSLTDIKFSVDSSIEGLQGLTARPVTISNLDVNHGFPDYLLIRVDSAIFNPSNLTIGTGDVAFGLQFLGQTIGAADLNNLIITPGNVSYPTDVHYAPQGGAVAAGRTLLQNFIQGIDSATTIAGSTDSTPIASLQSALSQIKLTPVVIPALHQNLITSASLTFPLDIVQTGIASSTFTLANPFTASINLLRVSATAIFHGLTLGAIENVDLSSSPIHAGGHSNVTSPDLPLHFNLDPVTIIQLLTISAQEHNVDLGPLIQLFQIVLNNPKAHTTVTTSVDTSAPTCVSGHQFDVNGAILKALQGLRVELVVDSSVKLDDFATDLAFNQTNVPAITDKTSLFLIGAVAAPIAQSLVDGAVLAFSQANITNITNEGFDLSLRGSLTNVGPLDALITFVDPLTVNWQGHNIATIALPPVCAAANTGVPNYETSARLTITDMSQFTSFATFILHNPSFTWTISTPNLRVDALGTIFDHVVLSKDVSFKAFNGLPGLSISNFQLPRDDPAGGIEIDTDALIPSPAQLGIDLGTVAFQAFFENTLVGPLSGAHLFLAANSITKTHLTGRIIPQSGSNLDTIGTLFTQFLAGNNQTLTARGESVQPDGTSQPVTWLSDAFKTLSLDVTLPGQKFQIIQSISLFDLGIIMQTPAQAFTPLASSSNTLATYKNPFGFSLQVIEAGEDITLSFGGADAAELKLPKVPANGGVSTGNVADLAIAFHNQPLQSLNDAAFEALFSAVTLKDLVTLGLKGTADVVARTTIGDVPISGIAFNVPSSLKGINGFGGTAALSNVSVTGSGGAGGNEFVVSPLTTGLQNPSNVSLQTVDIALPVIFKDVMIGRAAINPFNLTPGENVIPAEFHYEPQDANDTVAQSFLSEFLQTGDNLALTIKGDSASTPFASLEPALSGLQLSASLHGMNAPPIITHVHVTITLATLVTNFVTIDFDIHNPLDTDLVIEFVQADAGVHGQNFAHFDQPFSHFVVPPGQTVNSGSVPNVLLTQGAINSLQIIPLGMLDIFAVSTTRLGQGGYQVPWLHLTQLGVPTKYDVSLPLVGGLLGGLLGGGAKAPSNPNATSMTHIASNITTSPASQQPTVTPASASITNLPLGVSVSPTSQNSKTTALSSPSAVASA